MMTTRTFSALEIVEAFVAATARDGDDDQRASYVTLALRGTPYGYIRVYGPNGAPGSAGAPCVLVERYNGAVVVTSDAVATALGASRRPDDKLITEHPLGASSGGPGNFGAAKWGLAPAEIAKRFATPLDAVTAVRAAFDKAGVPW